MDSDLLVCEPLQIIVRPSLSIVTISFNQRPYLTECLDSVATQLVASDDYIVVDPGSTDGSRELVKNYFDQGLISKAVLEPDSGPADGLNRGFAVAKGDILAYLNSDDLFLPGALDYVRRYFDRHPEVDVLVSPIKLVDGKGRYAWRGRAPSYLTVAGMAGECCYYVQQGTFIRSAAYGKTMGFNVKNRTCWDYELLTELALAGARIQTIMRPLAAFRIHAESITGMGNHAQLILTDCVRIRKRMRTALGWNVELSQGERVRRFLSRFAVTRRATELMAAFY